MKLYQLKRCPDTDGGDPEGMDYDEWYSTLAEAKRRRAECVREVRREEPPEWSALQSHGFTGSDLAIYEHQIDTTQPLQQLLLAVLNRRRYSIVLPRLVVAPVVFRNGKRVRGGKP